MPDWAIWIVVAAALAAGEIFTLGFFLGPVALAAGLAAVIAALGGGIVFQLVAFIAGSLASLLVLRPIAVRHLKTPRALRTGTAALVGARGTVLERVDDLGGRVKIGGEVWTARAMFEGHVIEPGTRVEVAKIEGATALVYE
jgi:membrane protein implicated in regulation of membrane protease activity